MSRVERREWKVVSREGGATEGLINHSCIVIDFLLKGVSQTLNYVFVCIRVCLCVDVCGCVCMCVYMCVCCTVLIGSTKSSITALHFPKVLALWLV